MKSAGLVVTFILLATQVAHVQVSPDNSNLWPVHRDTKQGFRISYPVGWVVIPPKGANVKFSVNPPDGPGNCNVVARPALELASLSQNDLNVEVQALPHDVKAWTQYAGLSSSAITLIESRRANILEVPALVATMETALENLEGKFVRKQMVAFTLTPGVVWSLNCGATSFSVDVARARFTELQPTFSKVFGSFTFLK